MCGYVCVGMCVCTRVKTVRSICRAILIMHLATLSFVSFADCSNRPFGTQRRTLPSTMATSTVPLPPFCFCIFITGKISV